MIQTSIEVDTYGNTCWYRDGTYHREDGPAVVSRDGKRQSWWINGKLHRADGPAVIDEYGNQSWYWNDERHRIDGPACEDHDGSRFWYIHGKHVTDDVEKWLVDNNIHYPFDQENLILFKLTFGGQ